MSQDITIMLSSTQTDLKQYRQEAVQVIDNLSKKNQNVKLSVKWMEEEPQSGKHETALSISKQWVEESNWVVLIVGFNYGWIPPDDNPKQLSITELEYRHARDSGMERIFVFVAGDQNSTAPYKHTGVETVNLRTSLEDASDTQKKQLRDFKDGIQKEHLTFFSNLADFKDKLEKALQKAISTLPQQIPPGALLELMKDLRDPTIKQCVATVKLLATFKKIHDQLHEILQKAIRPLREGILNKWEEQENLSGELESRRLRRIGDAKECKGAIKSEMSGLGSESLTLSYQLGNIINHRFLQENEEEIPTLEAFTESLDSFASDVNAAFSEANTLMQRQVTSLMANRGTLREQIDKRLATNQLTEVHVRKLKEELNNIKVGWDRFFKVLDTHDTWQKLHDRFDLIDLVAESGKIFERKLREFCSSQAATISNVIEGESQLAKDDSKQNFQQSLITLRENWEEICEGVKPEAGGKVTISPETYETMRKAFEDVFYSVDKRTLAEVNRASECVNAFDQSLESLWEEQSMTPPA